MKGKDAASGKYPLIKSFSTTESLEIRRLSVETSA